MSPHLPSRRQALSVGGLAALASGCGMFRAGTVRTAANLDYLRLAPASAPGRVAFGRYATEDPYEVLAWVVPQVTDLSWLSRGDSVFVKVACNSPHRHPAVTAPEAVRALVRYLRERGAGTIYVGDQSGAEHVRLWASGRRSSTREMMSRNGLLSAITESGATAHFFDDQGWDGYFQPSEDFSSRWQGALWLPSILQRVDHVIYLPRLGAHSVAGYTCGIKNAVGWLRDDSRLALHRQGPLFFERIADINHVPALRDKLRLVLTLGSHALANIGPDFGAVYDLEGWVGMASTNLLDHDALALALLPYLDSWDASVFDLYEPYPRHVDHWNRGFVRETWGDREASRYEPMTPNPLGGRIEHDACLSRLAVLQRYRPERIEVIHSPGGLPGRMREYLRTYGGGLFRV